MVARKLELGAEGETRDSYTLITLVHSHHSVSAHPDQVSLDRSHHLVLKGVLKGLLMNVLLGVSVVNSSIE